MRMIVVLMISFGWFVAMAGSTEVYGGANVTSRADYRDADESMTGNTVAYNPDKDLFYQKKRIHVTWIMIWNGSTEKWWKESDYHGCKILVDGKWVATNWNDDKQIDLFCAAMRDAGINVIAVDFTNGFRWERQAKRVQEFCYDNGMKFVLAFNPEGGRSMEAGCRTTWDTYASPAATFRDAYLHKDGKPLVVLYTTKTGYQASVGKRGPYGQMFSTVWASGDESANDKWGWQLEPDIGPMGSGDAMFVTGSVKRYGPKREWDEWRRHLAWLDYGFITARRHGTRFVVVGSFDDIHERNAWFVADTTQARQCLQARGSDGALSTDAYYTRVKEWLAGSPSVVQGGLIPDGAYLVKASDGQVLGVEENREIGSPVVLKPYKDSLDHYVWFYHLGDNVYRMIKLNAGLAIEAKASGLCITWDSADAAQRWSLEKSEDGYSFINRASGLALSVNGGNVATEAPDKDKWAQRWSLIQKATVLE